MKAIAVLRVSTIAQQIEDQKKEIVSFASGYGYKEEDLVYVEAIGASAVKMDEKYMEMAGRIKEKILEGGIDAVFVWEISRLGRNEVILMDFKEFFINNKIQFYCKNPTLKLLNDDGSVNAGTELAFSLFATMAKQEAAENKARFKRAKSAMREKGQYVGGNTRKFGYKVENKYFVIDEEEAELIRKIYGLYSTGEYSIYTLSHELKERGIDAPYRTIGTILQSKHYCGEEENGRKYPAIVSKELWNKCEEVRNKNKIQMKRGERLLLGAKLVKCPVCGATCTSNSKHYVCSRHAAHGSCTNGFALRQYVVDDVLWRVASTLHMEYLIELSEEEKEGYRKTKEILEEKVQARRDNILKEEQKKERLAEMYVEGLIDREKLATRRLKVEDDIRVHLDAINSLTERIAAIAGILEKDEKSYEDSFMDAFEESELADKYDVIHRHIKSLVARQVSYGKRDPRTTRPNAVEIVITAKVGSIWKFMYFPKYYQGHNLYVWSGKKWVGDRVTPPSQF